MFDSETILWLVPGLPLLGCIFSALMGVGKARSLSHLPVVLGSFGSFLCVAMVLYVFNSQIGGPPILETKKLTWFEAGPISITFGLYVDPLTLAMLLAITFIGSWIVVFSIGYMHHDPGYTRFFAVVSLFIFSMTLLVMSSNLLGMVAGWEGVGLCSYLLVGFWHAKPSAAAAARKAFLVTRLGDCLMLLGIFLLWSISGSVSRTLEFDKLLLNASVIDKAHHDTLSLACLLLFCGAIGKSAQVPLYVWLPDAMEGPTPVSALIHAATMVTAGVYLLARCAPLFALCPEVQLTVSIIGALTALIAAFIALTQNDLKRVLAYSTVSQLGYMFLALGCGSPGHVTIVVIAAIFHLFTHAFFKAVLFLSSGSVMHAMGDVIDMRKFGGLRKVLPITHLTFLCGALALAGFPLLSGFWSKDKILEVTLEASHGPYGEVYQVLFGVALLTAFMTAFYTFRAYFKTFWGETRIPPEAGDHAHESPFVMTLPLIVLALGAVVVGATFDGFTGWFSYFLAGGADVEHHLNWPLIIGSVAVGLFGIVLAYWFFARNPQTADRLSNQLGALYYLSLNRLYVDELYNTFLVRPMVAAAIVCKFLENLFFDLVRTIAALPTAIAAGIRPLQNGLVQFYGLSMVVGVAAFLFYLILWSGR